MTISGTYVLTLCDLIVYVSLYSDFHCMQMNVSNTP